MACSCHGLAPGNPAAITNPREIMQLPPDEELVLISGMVPIRAEKLKYYEDRNFIERTLPAQAGTVITDAPVFHDWEGVTADIHDDLLEASRGAWKSDDEIERERAYGKPFKSMHRKSNEDDDHARDDMGEDIAAKIMARPGKDLTIAQRVYGADRDANLDLIGER